MNTATRATGAPPSTTLTTSTTATDTVMATVVRPRRAQRLAARQDPLLLLETEQQPVVGDGRHQESGGQRGQHQGHQVQRALGAVQRREARGEGERQKIAERTWTPMLATRNSSRPR